MKKITHVLHVRPAKEQPRASAPRARRRRVLTDRRPGRVRRHSSAATGRGATSPNIVTDGGFETTTAPTSTYSHGAGGRLDHHPRLDRGHAGALRSTGGSVESDRRLPQLGRQSAGNYSIDLGGTSSEAGGIYQDVADDPGVEYSLSYWTAVNGDQASGINRTP